MMSCFCQDATEKTFAREIKKKKREKKEWQRDHQGTWGFHYLR